MKLTRKTAALVALSLVIAGSIPATIVTIWLYPQVIDNTEQIDTVTQDAAVAKARAEIASSQIRATRKFNRKLTRALVVGCKANNVVKLRLRQYFKGQIDQVRQTNPELFPDIPPETFDELVAEEVDQLQVIIDDLPGANCPERYPGVQSLR